MGSIRFGEPWQDRREARMETTKIHRAALLDVISSP
jgi:hypothetical protein